MSVTNTLEGAVSMSIYSVLKGEHAEVKALFATIKAAPDVADSSKESLFNKLRKELLSHAVAEQETVYARAAERIPKDEIKDAIEDHQEIENLLMSMRLSDVTSEEWKTAFDALRTRVERHIEEEEGSMFDQMKDEFSNDEAEQLGKAFHDAKELELKKLENEEKGETVR